MHRALAVAGVLLVSAVAAAQQPPTLTPLQPAAQAVTPQTIPTRLSQTAIQGNALSALSATAARVRVGGTQLDLDLSVPNPPQEQLAYKSPQRPKAPLGVNKTLDLCHGGNGPVERQTRVPA